MLTTGWVKQWRKMLEWEWHDDPYTFSLFGHLTMLANIEEVKWHGITIPRGSLVTSYRSLNNITGIPQTTLTRLIDRLQKCGSITAKTIKAERNFTLITICNFDIYQDTTNEVGTQTERERNVNGTNSERERNVNGTNIRIKEIENKESINKNNEKSSASDSQFSLEILMQYVKDHNINITEKGVRQFKKFNEKLPQPYNGGDLETAFDNFLEKKFNRKFKKVSGPPPAVVSNPPPPQPLSLAEVAAKLQFHKDSQAKWDKVLETLSETLNQKDVRTWFLPLKVDVSEDNKQMQIICTKFLMETIEQKYATELKQAILKNFKQMPKVSYKCS